MREHYTYISHLEIKQTFIKEFYIDTSSFIIL
jgi:hypothetical protein